MDATFFTTDLADAAFQTVLELERFVAMIEASSGQVLSWPAVQFCDELWTKTFSARPLDGVIFYSTTNDHNYDIDRFGIRVLSAAKSYLTVSKAEAFKKDQSIYCLRLPSVEHSNIPMYAMVVHEIGHALYDKDAESLGDIQNRLFEEYFSSCMGTNNTDQNEMVEVWLEALTQEIFCDVVASLIAGPAFVLALNELAWTHERHLWSITVTESGVEAYPSLNLRLQIAVEQSDFNRLVNSHSEFGGLPNTLREIPALLSTMDFALETQDIHVDDLAGEDGAGWTSALTKEFNERQSQIIDLLRTFASQAAAQIRTTYEDRFEPVVISDLVELLDRLGHFVIPNVVRDETHDAVLGRPASLRAILIVGALARADALNRSAHTDADRIARLTEKAIEAAYIQRRYNERKQDERLEPSGAD